VRIVAVTTAGRRMVVERRYKTCAVKKTKKKRVRRH
jgi:hypothetical protein